MVTMCYKTIKHIISLILHAFLYFHGDFLNIHGRLTCTQKITLNLSLKSFKFVSSVETQDIFRYS